MQARFVLLGFLYLASTLATIQAVIYIGDPKRTVKEGEPFTIECSNLIRGVENYNWTRNGVHPTELSYGGLSVERNETTGSSKLTSDKADEKQAGVYRCVPNSNASIEIVVKSVFKTVVVTEKNVPLVLTCENSTTSDKVQWDRTDGKNMNLMKAGDAPLYSINNTLTILRFHEDVIAKYTCQIITNNNNNASVSHVRVVPKPVAKLVKSQNAIEGEKYELSCDGKFHPGVKVEWVFAGESYIASRDRVKLIPDKDGYNVNLLVENIKMSDAGPVSCLTKYDPDITDYEEFADVTNNATLILRVKTKYAALIPFLGICAEVFVLCAIILIYEKKRNKAELDESDTDQSPDTKPMANKDSDVRQRK